MTVLSDKDMRELINKNNAVKVKEGPEVDLDLQLGPSSLDLRLGYEFGVLKTRRVKAIDTQSMKDYSDIKEGRRGHTGRGHGCTPRRVLIRYNP
jgi:hypothetical protein